LEIDNFATTGRGHSIAKAILSECLFT